MMTIRRGHAGPAWDLAQRYLTEGSAWDCMQSALLAYQLDPGLEDPVKQLTVQAAAMNWSRPHRRSDELCRLDRFSAKLRAAIANELAVRESGLQLPPVDSTPWKQPGDPVPPALRRELAQFLHCLDGEKGPHLPRVRQVLSDLLERCSPPATGEVEAQEDVDSLWNEYISLEHKLHNLGNSFYNADCFVQAIALYGLAILISPKLLEPYFNRSLAHTRETQYDRAEEDLTTVIEMNDSLAEVWYTRGVVLKHKVEYLAALSDFERALEIDPAYHKAAEQRTVVLRKIQELQRGAQQSRSGDDYEGVIRDYSVYRIKPDCRLSQVGGYAHVKREFRKILTYLRGGEILDEWGAELPRGVLLHGEPGVGKTHLARALAGEAEVPFYVPPMSVLFDMYVGNSEKSLRNLFEAAAVDEHAIVFLDELDVLASHRQASRQAHEPHHARFAACLLEEMDNVAKRNAGVVVIAATNCLEAIDAAFLRPGRFTYLIEVERPNEVAMTEIFLACLETALLRAKRLDSLQSALRQAILAPRQEWLVQAFRKDETGLVDVACLAVRKGMVGDDVREICRRAVDERVLAGLDGLDLGPIAVEDVRRHVQAYRVARNTSFHKGAN